MKKLLPFSGLLLAALLCASCGNSAAQTETPSQTAPVTESETDAGTERPYYDTKGADYGGYTFGIWNFDNVTATGWTGIPGDLFVQEMCGDILNDAVYKRNLKIENDLNITIKGTDVAENFSKGLQAMVAAGEYGVDLIFPLQIDVPSLINNNLVCSVQSVEAFDFSEPWWNKNCNETMTIRGKLFTVASDANYYDKLSTVVTFFNQKLVADYGLGNMYSLVKEGKWTLDEAIALGKNVTADLDGNGTYDANDSIGISCQNDAAYYFIQGFGVTICAPDKDGNVRLNLQSQHAMDALQSIYTLMGDSSRFFNRQTYNLTLNDAINIFKENRSLFMIRPLQSLFVMREMDADFGIIPLPKYDLEQDGYHSAVNPWAGTICMLPRTAEDIERSAVVLSALACESHYSVISELYETVLGEKLIRDQDSPLMLDYAFGGIVFDTGLIWNFGGIRDSLLNHKGTEVASMLEKVAKSVEKAVEKTNQTIDEAE